MLHPFQILDSMFMLQSKLYNPTSLYVLFFLQKTYYVIDLRIACLIFFFIFQGVLCNDPVFKKIIVFLNVKNFIYKLRDHSKTNYSTWTTNRARLLLTFYNKTMYEKKYVYDDIKRNGKNAAW